MSILQKETNIGLIREKNEDSSSILVHPKNKKIKLLLVADGMGGKEYGEKISKYVSKTIEKWFLEKEPSTLNNTTKTIDLLQQLIEKMNKTIINKYGKNNAGTTLSLAIVNEIETLIINIGDSRTYTYSNNKLIQITEDDSDVWFYYKYGACKKDDLRFFFNNNIITACIGLSEELCRISTYTIDNNYEMLLLFTDGVTDIITDRKIKKIIKNSTPQKVLSNIIYETVYIDQNLKIPLRLKRKKYSKYILPFKGRDNASGAIYIK